MGDQKLLSGFIRLHILHHAAEEPIYGSWMAEELGHHGYRIGPGTLYPLLHGLERDGYLKSRSAKIDGKPVRVYRETAKGGAALAEAKLKLKELFHELVEDHHPNRDRKR